VKGKNFISGPIQNIEKGQSYRETIKRICREKGYVVIDPWEREKIIYSAGKASMVNFNFISRDLEDIKNCDILVAYMPKLSAGTCMELFYAKQMGKKDDLHMQNQESKPMDSGPLG